MKQKTNQKKTMKQQSQKDYLRLFANSMKHISSFLNIHLFLFWEFVLL